MTLQDVLDHFKVKPHELADMLDVSRGAVSQWKSAGIPEGRQWQVQALSNGALKASTANSDKAA